MTVGVPPPHGTEVPDAAGTDRARGRCVASTGMPLGDETPEVTSERP